LYPLYSVDPFTESFCFKRAAIAGSNRVLRGGNWNGNAQNCRSANRNHDRPENRNNNVGFRLVFVP